MPQPIAHISHGIHGHVLGINAIKKQGLVLTPVNDVSTGTNKGIGREDQGRQAQQPFQPWRNRNRRPPFGLGPSFCIFCFRFGGRTTGLFGPGKTSSGCLVLTHRLVWVCSIQIPSIKLKQGKRILLSFRESY